MSYRHNSVYRNTMFQNMPVHWLFRMKNSFPYSSDCIKSVRFRFSVQIFIEPILQLIFIITLGFGLTNIWLGVLSGWCKCDLSFGVVSELYKPFYLTG